MIEIYGTSPYVELDVDQSSIDLEQGEPSVLIAALPIKGDQGDPGPAFETPAWWFDDGPPFGGIVGTKPGDLYMDLTTGTIYRLGG